MTELLERRATLEDLYAAEGPAELIGGSIVRMSTGDLPGVIGGQIFRSLADHADRHGGRAYPDGVGFVVTEMPSGRESFCPDVSYYHGPHASGRRARMRFLPHPPIFAVEVRSENDYGPAAEERLAEKRADYFAAGTVVVWDVDPLAETVTVHRAGEREGPTVRGRGESVDAEPAVAGWSMPVDRVFD